MSDWSSEEWAVKWPGLPPLGSVNRLWTTDTPLRSERARRSALVELDALVALWLGMPCDQLLAIYRSRYPVLAQREENIWFDALGRRIAADAHAFGHGQTKSDYLQLKQHIEHPERIEPPNGYTAPFFKADREAEYREAHAVFSERLEQAKAGRWAPDDGGASA